jgi:hypothetical protein
VITTQHDGITTPRAVAGNYEGAKKYIEQCVGEDKLKYLGGCDSDGNECIGTDDDILILPHARLVKVPFYAYLNVPGRGNAPDFASRMHYFN